MKYRETFYIEEGKFELFYDAEKISCRWERTFYKQPWNDENPIPLDFNPHTGEGRLPLTNTNISKMGCELLYVQKIPVFPSLLFYQDMSNEHGKEAAAALAGMLRNELVAADLEIHFDLLAKMDH